MFVSVANTANGDVGTGTQFRYRQCGPRVWSIYESGSVRFGSLVALADAEGRLEMRYRHLDSRGLLRAGECQSTPEILPDGRLRLHESWRWTNGDLSDGRSILEEIAR